MFRGRAANSCVTICRLHNDHIFTFCIRFYHPLMNGPSFVISLATYFFRESLQRCVHLAIFCIMTFEIRGNIQLSKAVANVDRCLCWNQNSFKSNASVALKRCSWFPRSASRQDLAWPPDHPESSPVSLYLNTSFMGVVWLWLWGLVVCPSL